MFAMWHATAVPQPKLDVLHGLPAALHVLEEIPHMLQRALVVLTESFHLALGLLPGCPDIRLRIAFVLGNELIFGVFGPALKRILVILHRIVGNQLGAFFGELDGSADRPGMRTISPPSQLETRFALTCAWNFP